MRINVFNEQDRHGLDGAGLEAFLSKLAQRLQIESGFSILLVDDDRMAGYNGTFRGKAVATDVLSFPNQPEDWESEGYLGDVVISVEAAHRQRQANLMTELKVLCLHGLLHLMGYDHETDEGQMARLEADLKKEFRLS